MEIQMAAKNFQNTVWRKALLVTGFAAGFAVAAGAQAQSTQPHSDGVGAAITDTAITAKVKTQLTGDQLKNSNISVTTTNGVVTLTGSAASSDAKSYAEAQAKGVDGVKSVDDEINTAAVAGSMAADTDQAATKVKHVAKDSWITTKVKSEILADSVSKGFHVKVITHHGVVFLRGTLANDDAVAHVKDIASQVDGVKSVDTSRLKTTGA
jgi:hyperosmotically inducible periplasmic protein